MIRLTIPSIEADDIQAVVETLQSGFLVQGQRVKQFESLVADLTGTKEAVAVSSCTAALHLALVALGVSAGDLVIVPAYSWLSTANVVELCGATPVFVDIEPDSFNISVEALKLKLGELLGNSQTAQRLKAVIPVHVFGQMADMTAITNLCQQYAIPIIEDAACALGATLKGKAAGNWGTMGCFSFHPRKAITTGEGGMIVTNDPLLANRLRALRNHGLDPEAAYPDFIMAGYNYRMTELQAALGCTQILKLTQILENRREAAECYNSFFKDSQITPPSYCLEPSAHTFQSYVVLLPSSFQDKRSKIIAKLRQKGIEATIGTYHMPMTRHFQTKYSYQLGDFRTADKISESSLTLPLHEGLHPEEQLFIAQTLLMLTDQVIFE